MKEGARLSILVTFHLADTSSKETYATLIAWKVSLKQPEVRCLAQGHMGNWTGSRTAPEPLLLRIDIATFRLENQIFTGIFWVIYLIAFNACKNV